MTKYVNLNKSQVFQTPTPLHDPEDIEDDLDWRDDYVEEVFGPSGTEEGGGGADKSNGDKDQERDDGEGIQGVSFSTKESVETVENLIEILRTLRGRILWSSPEEKRRLWNEHGRSIVRTIGSLSSIQGK